MPYKIISQKLLIENHIEGNALLCVYMNILQFFCTELNVVDCLALIVMVKQKDLLTTQEHVIDDKIKHVSSVLATEIPSVSVIYKSYYIGEQFVISLCYSVLIAKFY